MRQGYLSLDKERTVRVRVAGDAAWLTVKGLTTGLSRRERVSRRSDNRRRYHELEEVNARLAELATQQRIALDQELEQIDRELQANEILQSREFSFAMYPAETLRAFLTNLPSPS